MDNDLLKYKYLNNFDAAMNKLESVYGWLSADPVSIFILFLLFVDFYLSSFCFFLVFIIVLLHCTNWKGDKIVTVIDNKLTQKMET